MESTQGGPRRGGGEPGPLERTLGELIALLDRASIPHAVTGDLAALAHGALQVTRDIELIVSLDVASLPRLIEALGERFRPLVTDPPAFVAKTRALPLEGAGGTRAEVLFAGIPFEEDAVRRARVGRLGGVEARVCLPSDLVVLRLVSRDPRDREGLAGILEQIGAGMDLDGLDRLVETLSRDLERPEMLSFWRGLRADR